MDITQPTFSFPLSMHGRARCGSSQANLFLPCSIDRESPHPVVEAMFWLGPALRSAHGCLVYLLILRDPVFTFREYGAMFAVPGQVLDHWTQRLRLPLGDLTRTTSEQSFVAMPTEDRVIYAAVDTPCLTANHSVNLGVGSVANAHPYGPDLRLTYAYPYSSSPYPYRSIWTLL